MRLAILVTGSRHEKSRQRVKAGLRAGTLQPRLIAHRTGEPIWIRLIHGDAPGVDKLAAAIAAEECPNWDVLPRPADWTTHGKKAGPIRNGEMVAEVCAWRQEGWEVVCVAFPGPDSIGTWDCIRQASKAKITVHIHPEETT